MILNNESSIFHYSEIKLFLKDTVESIKMKKPGLSLRSIAGKALLAPSTLSEVMSGKKKLSMENALKIVNYLELDRSEKNHLILLAEKQFARTNRAKTDIEDRIAINSPLVSIEIAEEIQSRIDKEHVIDYYHYITEDKKMSRTLMKFGQQDFSGFFCDSFSSIDQTFSGYAYFLPNNDSSYRAYYSTLLHSQTNNPYLFHANNLRLKVDFDTDGFPSIENIRIKRKSSAEYTLGHIIFSDTQVEVCGSVFSTHTDEEIHPLISRLFYRLRSV